jgi:hypothetical protein
MQDIWLSANAVNEQTNGYARNAVGISFVITPVLPSLLDSEDVSFSSVAVIAYETAYPLYPSEVSLLKRLTTRYHIGTNIFVACGVSAFGWLAVSHDCWPHSLKSAVKLDCVKRSFCLLLDVRLYRYSCL